MALKREYQIFVDEMVKHGDENKAILKAYPHLKGDAKRIRTYCGRLMKNVEVREAINKKASKIANLATKKAVEALKDEIVAEVLTVARKREILHKIATDDKKDLFARMKAIEIDNKMAGDNAPTKAELTGKDGKPLPTAPSPIVFMSADKLTDEQLKQFMPNDRTDDESI